MKNIRHNTPRFEFALFAVLVSLLSVFCGESSAQNFKAAHPGVEYEQIDHKIANDPVKINLLRLDLTKVRIDVHHALDAAIGTETTSSIATRHGAVAAINAGFFRLDNSIFAGDAAGILKIDRRVFSEDTQKRSAIFIDNQADKTLVSFNHLETRSWFEVKARVLEVSGINRERKENELIEYTPKFHSTTLTSPNGSEVIVRKGKVIAIRKGLGSSLIPPDGLVLSASGSRQDNLLKWMKVGSKVKGFTAVSGTFDSLEDTPPYGYEDITNGVPQLLKGGKIDITWQQEKASKSFAEMRHPRTAVAKMKDGKFLMITVDGRQPGVSVGMTLQELAEYLLSLGATDAMNLDGGGSTTMFLDGKIANTPSDKEGERKVGDAILVTLRTNAHK
ncbi:MAG: phosphodiester glycosidase family protein [Acidobacteriota bacterium]